MRVLLFGPMADLAGVAALELPPCSDAASVLAAVAMAHPQLAALCVRSRVACGDAFVVGALPDSCCEIAVIPPVSGG